MKPSLRFLFAFLLAPWYGTPASAEAPPGNGVDLRTKHHNLDRQSLALSGYDPVTYFHNQPQKGLGKISLTYKGVTYRFTSEENKIAFAKDPSRYEPAYGGWCAYAMRDGEKVKVNPETYKIVEGRLFLFYDALLGDTREKWNEQSAKDGGDGKQAARADQHWNSLLSATE
jgi:YHS domain-containing protein